MTKKGIAVYVRVSSTGQDLRSQEPDLKAWVRTHGRGQDVSWYHETFTGKTLKRPLMDRLEESIRAGKVGTLVVWRLDRLGRTAVETLRFLDDLEAAGVRFVCSSQSVTAWTQEPPRGAFCVPSLQASLSTSARKSLSASGEASRRPRRQALGRAEEGAATEADQKTLRPIRALLNEGTAKAEIARQLHLDRSTMYEAKKLLGR